MNTFTPDERTYQRLCRIRLRHCRDRHKMIQKELEEVLAFAKIDDRHAEAAVDQADRLKTELVFYNAQIKYNERVIASKNGFEMVTHIMQYQDMMSRIEANADGAFGLGQQIAQPTVPPTH